MGKQRPGSENGQNLQNCIHHSRISKLFSFWVFYTVQQAAGPCGRGQRGWQGTLMYWCSWFSCSLFQPIFMLNKCNCWIWAWLLFLSREFLFIGKNYQLGSNTKPHSRCHLLRETQVLDPAPRAPTGGLLGCGVTLTISPVPVRADPRER